MCSLKWTNLQSLFDIFHSAVLASGNVAVVLDYVVQPVVWVVWAASSVDFIYFVLINFAFFVAEHGRISIEAIFLHF